MGHFADFFVLIDRREQMHCSLRELRAIRLARVDGCLFRTVPAEHRHKLMLSSAVLRSRRGVVFADAVRRAMLQAGLIAPIPAFVAEAGCDGVSSRR